MPPSLLINILSLSITLIPMPLTVAAVKAPDTSAAPFISIVVAFISISVSETRSSTPSADWCMYVPESPNCSCLVLLSNIPVSAT